MIRLIFILWAFVGASAWAEEAPIGSVKSVTGEASVTTDGNKVMAVPGTPVFQGSVLQTGAKSAMGVTFKDETLMSFGEKTSLTVDEYVYAPAQGKLKLSSKLAKGSLNYVSGVIAHLQPDAVSIRTPSGVIGVRGTQFLVKVED